MWFFTKIKVSELVPNFDDIGIFVVESEWLTIRTVLHLLVPHEFIIHGFSQLAHLLASEVPSKHGLDAHDSSEVLDRLKVFKDVNDAVCLDVVRVDFTLAAAS